jgi:tetratricopeptide (TPR) repeat protein
MIHSPIIVFLLFLTACSLSAVPRPNSDTRLNSEETNHLFPGTGFFVKNRDAYNDEEAKAWFLEAIDLEKSNEDRAALKLFEKFIKRRSNLILRREDKKIIVGPESIYRAAAIREKNGDWKVAFDYLQLIAKAYPSYDFEKVAEALLRIAERLAVEKLPKKWGVLPRFRSGEEDRRRLSQIADLARGPRFAPRALIVLSEIALKDDKEEDAIDALERLINYYPDNYLCEKAYFQLGQIYQQRVSGPSYDQGATLKALNFYEDYLILFESPPPRDKRETMQTFNERINGFKYRKDTALRSRRDLRQILAASKLEIGSYIENYGKYFLVRWKELGNGPALQFYNEAITIAPDSEAAREAEKKVSQLRNE